MLIWILVGIIFILAITVYVLVKGSQDDNQAVSLNLTADEPITKESN